MSQQAKFTNNPSPQFLDQFIKLLSHSYLGTPLTTALITEIDATPPPYPSTSVNEERLQKHFSLGITAAARSNVLLAEYDSFTAAALFEPPDFSGTPPAQARKNPGPILQEWRDIVKIWKSKYLALPETGPHSFDQPAGPSQSSGGPGEDPYPSDFNKDIDVETWPFYHLAVMARDPSRPKAETEPAVKAVMTPILDRAKKEEVPVWLEATSGQSRREYENFGFRVCEEVAIGKGKVDAQGWPKDGGQGVKCWGMIYDQHLR